MKHRRADFGVHQGGLSDRASQLRVTLETEDDRAMDAPEAGSSVIVTLDDDIAFLGLSIRTFNALQRYSRVRTVRDLVRLAAAGELAGVRTIGPKCVAEIEEILFRTGLFQEGEAEAEKAESENRQAKDDLARLTDRIAVLEADNGSLKGTLWQLAMRRSIAVRRQVVAGLLHRDAIVLGRPLADWLASDCDEDAASAAVALSVALDSSANVCDELSYLLSGLSSRGIDMLIRRHGATPRTLEEIASAMDLTRERVRQLCLKPVHQIETRTIGFRSIKVIPGTSSDSLTSAPPLTRIQTALLRARDMGLEISYNRWKADILSSGLVGRWQSQELNPYDPVEVMLAACNASCHGSGSGLALPENLNYAIASATAGEPDQPARILHIRATLSHETAKLIDRHARHTGAVNARWLAQEINVGVDEAREIVMAVGFRAHSDDWFVPIGYDPEYKIHPYDVFHHAIRTMSKYCGPLSAESICGGLSNAVSRTSFPVPPPRVMTYLLELYGYQCGDDLFCCEKPDGEELSEAELIILDCIARNGPVVHHSELANTFVRSPLSLAALHPAISRSPIFEKVNTALYKLRGAPVTPGQIRGAEAAAESVPLDLLVTFDRRGYVVVCATVGALAIGSGTIVSQHLPAITGSWPSYVGGEEAGALEASSSEFRRLRRAFDLLHCHVGDRLKFTFDSWKHTVDIEILGE